MGCATEARLITLEGIEGAGKTSQVATVCRVLQTADLDTVRQRRTTAWPFTGTPQVVATREPGGTPFGEWLRAVLLDPALPALYPDAELLTLFAARVQHLHAVIQPALAAGHWVVCDRFIDASFAYQGGGRGVDPGRIEALAAWASIPRPGLTLLFDCAPDIGLARARERRVTDRFEQESAIFFTRVRNCYLTRAQAEPERVRLINAAQGLEQVSTQVEQAILSYLERLA